MKSNLFKLLFFIVLFSFCTSGAQQYDLVIINGHVIDSKNKLDQKMDVAISQGKIVAIEKSISPSEGKKVIDAEGLIVSPGLIDLHSHNFHGTEPKKYLANSFTALPPDGFTFRNGITTLVDAGSPGWRNFDTYKKQTIDQSKTRVLAFLNIVGNGMAGGSIEQNVEDMDPETSAAFAKKHSDYIVGFKLAHFSGYNWSPTERVVSAGELANMPVMIDFGGSQPELPLEKLLLEKLRPGDVFTHAYAQVKGRTPIVDETGKVRPYVFKAQERGIVFDVGHGGGSFVFDQAIPAMQQGLKPHTISTDLHTGSMNGGMKGLLNVMSKFLNFDMPLSEVLAAVTWHPAQVIQKPQLGNLSVGAEADVAILRVQKGDFGFVDTSKKKMKGTQKLICELTLREGNVVYDLNGLANPLWK
ncbi:amidohydrolase/deacetylase family metallohydrolase [Flavobacteriaceae bacterium]|nr:amidohydrolase/deacetylase family metallohydrolase [Flavobacteriaceae bacterium]MDA9037501.1 amidohydrolase/deacetylase family metallohydrolase [Flavobacteriaceae bacterium]